MDNLDIDSLLDAGPYGLRSGYPGVSGLADLLLQLPVEAVRHHSAAVLQRRVDQAWNRGWQPAEVVRQVRRWDSGAPTGLVRLAILADHASRSGSTFDARWLAQIAALHPPLQIEAGGADLLARWAAAESLDRPREMVLVIVLLHRLAQLRVLAELIPPPGGSRRPPRPGDPSFRQPGRSSSSPLLEKIRALLAKAEATTFEAEAEAFTAKAQELMARHAIDAALLDQARGSGEVPDAIRIAIEDPYVNPKSLLLHVVADAARCAAVFHVDIAVSTVVGFAEDLAAVEVMYTSLLVQAQSAMAATARNAPPGTAVRSRGFRTSFLRSYAVRIGQRLDDINESVIAATELERGCSLLPVLRSRDLAVAEAVEARLGPTTRHRSRGGYDAAGWASGKVAADNARIGSGFVGTGSG